MAPSLIVLNLYQLGAEQYRNRVLAVSTVVARISVEQQCSSESANFCAIKLLCQFLVLKPLGLLCCPVDYKSKFMSYSLKQPATMSLPKTLTTIFHGWQDPLTKMTQPSVDDPKWIPEWNEKHWWKNL